MVEYENLLSIVKDRRSCRRFKPEAIPDEYVKKIIDMARWAPSGANSQPWEFVVVKRKDLRQKISQFVKDFISIYYKLEHTREPALRFPSLTGPVDKIGYEDTAAGILLRPSNKDMMADFGFMKGRKKPADLETIRKSVRKKISEKIQ